ncbi:extracellular tyrosine-protein kinase PKDCC-like [Ischnura elegans]|uniref:extracellular tyrosine-protein kinase PKDCC-like n=1 Tax=Ischnura elegans TaxID=197161 RepID=UPI001ED874E0|nr:extracellular tyrosine-protein kinase PKDCC-like [Ischnura elegans]
MCFFIVSHAFLVGIAVTLLLWPGFDPGREEAAFKESCEFIDRLHVQPIPNHVSHNPRDTSQREIGRGTAGVPMPQLPRGIFTGASNVSGRGDDEGLPAEGGEFAVVKVLECSAVRSASDLAFIAGGWTKAVYRAKVRGRDVAIKTVNLNGLDFRECQRAGGSSSSCYRRVAVKILREMVLLRQLKHENIVQVLGSCIPDAISPVAMVTELGDPLDTISLLQLSWEDRLRMSLGMARILHHLAHSPLGSLAMNEFRRHQFVLVGRTTLKLSDVDDVGVTEPSCVSSNDCLLRLPSEMQNDSFWLERPSCPCIEGRCVGHNERLNVWRAGRHLIRLFLPPTAPSTLEPHIQELLEAYNTARWNSKQILEASQKLVAQFIPEKKVHRVYERPSNVEMESFDHEIPDG